MFQTIFGLTARTSKVIKRHLKPWNVTIFVTRLSDLGLDRITSNDAVSTLFARLFLPKGNILDGQRQKISKNDAYVLNHNNLRNDK